MRDVIPVDLPEAGCGYFGEDCCEPGRLVHVGAFERLGAKADDARLLQLKESGEGGGGVGVAPRELVICHDAEADQVAQRGLIDSLQLWMREHVRHRASTPVAV